MRYDNSGNDDWKVLIQFLPHGWEQKAKDFGSITRQRKIPTAEVLLRLLLIHLADGCSLRETVVRAKQANIADITDVALLKRLKVSSEWLRWIAVNLLEHLGGPTQKPEWLKQFNVRTVDASIITEPGSTGSDWRLHYSLELFGLNCDYLEVTTPTRGETFSNFPISRGDLVIGDRAYGTSSGITHVLKQKGDFLARLRNKAITLKAIDGSIFSLLYHFKNLSIGEIGDWPVLYSPSKNEWRQIRLCAVKKSPEAAENSLKKAKRVISKKQRKLDEETLELHKYFFLLTSVPKNILSGEQLLKLYSARWQVELAFKCLKSILGLGHLPKTEPTSAKAWLHGKLVVALLAHVIVSEGRYFSPWGYPLSNIRSR